MQFSPSSRYNHSQMSLYCPKQHPVPKHPRSSVMVRVQVPPTYKTTGKISFYISIFLTMSHTNGKTWTPLGLRAGRQSNRGTMSDRLRAFLFSIASQHGIGPNHCVAETLPPAGKAAGACSQSRLHLVPKLRTREAVSTSPRVFME